MIKVDTKYEFYVQNWSRNNLVRVCKAIPTHMDAFSSLLGASVYFGTVVHLNEYVGFIYLPSTVESCT